MLIVLSIDVHFINRTSAIQYETWSDEDGRKEETPISPDEPLAGTHNSTWCSFAAIAKGLSVSVAYSKYIYFVGSELDRTFGCFVSKNCSHAFISYISFCFMSYVHKASPLLHFLIPYIKSTFYVSLKHFCLTGTRLCASYCLSVLRSPYDFMTSVLLIYRT